MAIVLNIWSSFVPFYLPDSRRSRGVISGNCDSLILLLCVSILFPYHTRFLWICPYNFSFFRFRFFPYCRHLEKRPSPRSSPSVRVSGAVPGAVHCLSRPAVVSGCGHRFLFEANSRPRRLASSSNHTLSYGGSFRLGKAFLTMRRYQYLAVDGRLTAKGISGP